MTSEPEGELLFPQEVAALFRVDTKTVTRWADSGRLTVVRTLGGHRRFFKAEVMALREGRREGEFPWQPVAGASPSATAAAEERAPADATEA